MIKSSKKGGFLLVFSLLLTVIISLIALSLLQLRKASYASSQNAILAVQARALARGGIGDAWTKLGKDPFFPGGIGDEQKRFSYRENVTNDTGEVVGSFTVVVDRTHRFSHQIVKIESQGVAGDLGERSATFTIYTELSVDPDDFRFKSWQEGAAPSL